MSSLREKLLLADEVLRRAIDVIDAGEIPEVALPDAEEARSHMIGARDFLRGALYRLTLADPGEHQVAHCYALAGGDVCALAAAALQRAGLSSLLAALPSPAGLQ